MIARKQRLWMLLAFMLCLPASLQATPTFVADVGGPAFMGQLSTSSGGLIAPTTGSWANGFTVDWTVTRGTYGGSAYWEYSYKLAVGQGLSGGISHFVLEVTDKLTADRIVDSSIGFDIGRHTMVYSPHTAPNPSLEPIYGIKFDDETDPDFPDDAKSISLTFYSRQNPMLGDFYAKDGKPGGYVYNVNWANGNNSHDFADLMNAQELGKIVVPNTTVIPAPGAILLAGIGTTLVGWLRRRQNI